MLSGRSKGGNAGRDVACSLTIRDTLHHYQRFCLYVFQDLQLKFTPLLNFYILHSI
jgi:hypothetical protein